MKRFVTVIVIGLVAVGSAFAGGQGEGAATAAEELELNELGQLPLVNEKVTVEMFAQDPAYIVDWNTNDFTVWYEEQTNVHVEWNLAPSESLEEKRSLLLASGDYPEVFLYAGVTREEEVMHGSQGAFIPLNDLIDEHAVELQKVFGQRPFLRGAITTPDGNIYSMPSINECYHCLHSVRAWINQGWLDKLGLEMPTTTEELKEVLIAFRDQDPNDNGIDDEIPLTGATTGWETNVANFFINAFIYNEPPDRFYVNEGIVDVNYNKLAFQDALRFLNDLYEEGLIAPEAFTQDAPQLLQTGTDPNYETIGLGVASLWWSVVGQDEVINPDGTIRNRNYRALPPLEGPEGVRYATYRPFGTFSPMLQITPEAQYPELVVRWADKLYHPDFTLYANRGPNEGEDWRRAEPGEIGINGKPAIWKNLEESTSNLFNNRWANMGTMFRSSDYRLGQVAPPNNPWETEVRLYNVSANVYHPHVPNENMLLPPIYVLPEEVGELARLKTTINDYVDESIARFITGDLDIESEWESYVAELDTIGLERYLEIHQNAYDRQYGD